MRNDLSATERKGHPVYSGVLRYFPDAIAEIAHLSKVGNDQHNPGKPLHWDRSKSGDELDAAARHMLDAGTRDTDGERHSAKLAWRALANLQKEIEAERENPYIPPEYAEALKAARPNPVNYDALLWAGTPFGKTATDEWIRLEAARSATGAAPTAPLAIEGEMYRAVIETLASGLAGPESGDVEMADVDDEEIEGAWSGTAMDTVARVDELDPLPDGEVMLRRTSEDRPVYRTFRERMEATAPPFMAYRP